MVTDALVEEVRARADIAEVCGEHTRLKRSGKTYRGPCPLHGGEGPNFSVDPARGIFKCFVCNEGGDVFGFVMRRLGLDFPSAVRHLAERYGVEIPESRADREDPHARLREATAFAEEWFAARLREAAGSSRVREYLEGRGVGLEAAERFALGYAPDAWRALRDAALARGMDDPTLEEAGLVASSERAEEPYDRFRNRLTFSIRDLRDRPIAFGGRVLGDVSESIPKYINSPESPIFHKNRTLYGLVWARHAIRREGTALVVEGYMDVLTLQLNGFPAAVAPLGTALGPEQAELLARYARRVVLLYDSDRAGLRATFRTGDVLLAAGLHPMVASLPPGTDPDSVIRRGGPKALAAFVEDAIDILECKLRILERQGYLDTIEGKRRAVDGLLSTLRATRDPALRDLYFGRSAERIGVRRETLVSEVARQAPVRHPRPHGRLAERDEGDEASHLPADAGAAAERLTLLLLLRDPSLVTGAEEIGLRTEHFRAPANSVLFRAIRSGTVSMTGSDDPSLTPEAARLLAELRSDDTELTHPAEIFAESARKLVHRPRLARLEQINREIEDAEEEHQRELLKEKEQLARELREAGVSLSFVRRIGKQRAGEATPIG